MSEMLIPYRSQSHNINEFLNNVSSDIERLYEKYNAIDADAEMLVRAARLQEIAIAGKITELTNMLNMPKKAADGLWEHHVGITNFTPSGSGIIMPRFNAGSVIAIKTSSCITVETKDGQEILPNSVRVEVDPPADGKVITETNPLQALTGNRPWWRTIKYNGNNAGEAVYTVYLPTDILEHAEFNQIRITPFPLYLVTIESIEYRQSYKWRELPAPSLPSDGAILITTKPIKADAVRLRLKQKNPFWLDNEQKYNIGLANFAVERAVISNEKAVFTADIELAGEGPWKIVSFEADMATVGNVSAEISDGVNTVMSSALPITVTTNKIRLKIAVSGINELQRPLLRGVTIKYQDRALIV